MEERVQLHPPAALLPGGNPSIHWIGRLVSPRAGLEVFLSPNGIRTPDPTARSVVAYSAPSFWWTELKIKCTLLRVYVLQLPLDESTTSITPHESRQLYCYIWYYYNKLTQ